MGMYIISSLLIYDECQRSNIQEPEDIWRATINNILFRNAGRLRIRSMDVLTAYLCYYIMDAIPAGKFISLTNGRELLRTKQIMASIKLECPHAESGRPYQKCVKWGIWKIEYFIAAQISELHLWETLRLGILILLFVCIWSGMMALYRGFWQETYGPQIQNSLSAKT